MLKDIFSEAFDNDYPIIMKVAHKLLKNISLFFLILLIVEASLYTFSQLGKKSYMRVSKEIDTDSSAQRILCLGDSFTYGLGAERVYSYPAQLESLLNYNNTQKNFKVFYYGIDGLSSSIVANSLLDNIKKYRPDILIILAGCNDHWNLRQSNLPEVMSGRKINVGFLKVKIFLYNFRTFRLIQVLINAVKGKFKDNKKDNLAAMGFSNITDDSLIGDLIKYNYAKIIDIVVGSEMKIKLFFQTYPTGPKRINEIIKEVGREYKIRTIDQEKAFLRVKIKPLVSCDSWHLNAKGYNLMAKNIYEEFIKDRIINNKLTRDIVIQEKEEQGEIAKLNDDTWEYDLIKIAQHPEKIIIQQGGGWYFLSNNIVALPKVKLMPGEYILQIQAKGTSVNEIYPLVGFYYELENNGADSQKNELNRIYVNSDWKIYFSKKLILNNEQNVKFYISFENDALEIKNGQVSDRNLYINKIILKSL